MKLMVLFFAGMPNTVRAVLALTLLAWAYTGFKKIEPTMFPVIDKFEISEVYRDADGVKMRGTFTKARDCRFLAAIPYSQGHRVDLKAIDYEVVSRVTGEQEWGYWLVTPDVDRLTLYFRHSCSTGLVTSLIYDGALKDT